MPPGPSWAAPFMAVPWPRHRRGGLPPWKQTRHMCTPEDTRCQPPERIPGMLRVHALQGLVGGQQQAALRQQAVDLLHKGGNGRRVKAVSQRASPVDVKAHSTFPQYQLLTIRTQREQPVRIVAPSLIHGGMVLQQIIPSLQGTGKQAVPPGMGTGGEGRPERLPCFVHDMQVRYFHGR